MEKEQATAMLSELLPGKLAIEVLSALDVDKVDFLRIEGFKVHENGDIESQLDLILDFDHLQQLSRMEQAELAQRFISNRSRPNRVFEIIANLRLR